MRPSHDKLLTALALLAVLLLMYIPARAEACSYSDITANIQEEKLRADSVFSGKVLQIQHKGLSTAINGDDRLVVLFEVESVWKGKIGETTFVEAPSSSGYSFTEGEQYLVFASISARGSLEANSCGSSHRLGDVADSLKNGLGHGQAPQSLSILEETAVPLQQAPDSAPLVWIGLSGIAAAAGSAFIWLRKIKV